MIRTRDFLVFSGALVFLLTAITATWLTDSFGNQGQMANVISFAPAPAVEGVESYKHSNTRADNVERLRSKIAAGEGDVSIGEPVFTSVDDIAPSNSSSSVTDQTPPTSVQIGVTQYGQTLMSDELWRFIGYSQFDQVGVAQNGTSIFGSRSDNAPLDACGGTDDGTGYRLHLHPSQDVQINCFTNIPPSL